MVHLVLSVDVTWHSVSIMAPSCPPFLVDLVPAHLLEVVMFTTATAFGIECWALSPCWRIMSVFFGPTVGTRTSIALDIIGRLVYAGINEHVLNK